MTANKLSWGLFCHKKYWYLNVKDIYYYIKRIIFVLKHGYSEQAQWETYYWFMSVMKEIITNYRYNRNGTPAIIGHFDDDEANIIAYNNDLDNMLKYLDMMDENNSIYEDMNYVEAANKQIEAKNNFMMLFSKYFYNLWD